ncbi:MAG: TraB domain-containing protein [Candidatus Nanosalina sp.]
MTIKIYGTSHVSQESIDVIEEAFGEEPDIVALELDPPRLEALMFNGHGREGGDLFIRLLEKFQKYIGSKTGLMPGEEMLYAYNRAIQENLDVALVDQDIRVTVQRLKQVRRKEKVKAFGSVILGLLLPFGDEFDLSKIPSGDKVDLLVAEMSESFPEIYEVMMEERNVIMAESLMRLQEDNPDSDIAVFLGAAHKNPVEEILEAEGFEVRSEGRLEEKERKVES